ncbi:hypothetical protein [Planctomycetes bacterium Pan216]
MPNRQSQGVIVLAVVLVAGCGDSQEPPPYPSSRVTGSITIDGKPIEEGRVQFLPKDSAQGPVTSAEIREGTYTLDRVPMGKQTAILTATRKTGRMIDDYGKPFPEVVNIIPETYRDGITIDISEKEQRCDFELESRDQ